MVDVSTPYGQRTQERLESEQVVWLVTTGKDGTPQPNPVWFLWHDGKALIFSEPNQSKIRNIERTGRVALHFNDKEGGDVTVLTGAAAVTDAVPSDDVLQAYLAKYDAGIKSLGLTMDTMVEKYSAVLWVTPEKVRGH